MKRVHAFVLSAVVAAAAPLAASDGPRPDLTALARRAERVVVATVTRVEPVFQTNEFGDRLIVSRAHLRVETMLKHDGGPEALVLEVEGGTIGDLTLSVSDLPTLEPGERAVVFARRNSRGEFVPEGRGHGILKLDSSDRVQGRPLTLAAVRQAVEQAR